MFALLSVFLFYGLCILYTLRYRFLLLEHFFEFKYMSAVSGASLVITVIFDQIEPKPLNGI